MRIVTALWLALIAAVVLATPASAQGSDGSLSWKLDCAGNPESLTLTNNFDRVITVTGIGAGADRRSPLFVREDPIAPGASVTYLSGSAAPEGDPFTLTQDFLLDENAGPGEDPGLLVRFGPRSRLSGIGFGCARPTGVFTPRRPGQVLVSFELTLRGDVPKSDSFGLTVFEVGSFDGEGFSLCGGTVVTASLPDCTGGSVYYTRDVAFPRGTSISYAWARNPEEAAPRAGPAETFFSGTVKLDGDTTVSAFYDYAEGRGGGRVLPGLPSTGGGGASRP